MDYDLRQFVARLPTTVLTSTQDHVSSNLAQIFSSYTKRQLDAVVLFQSSNLIPQVASQDLLERCINFILDNPDQLEAALSTTSIAASYNATDVIDVFSDDDDIELVGAVNVAEEKLAKKNHNSDDLCEKRSREGISTGPYKYGQPVLLPPGPRITGNHGHVDITIPDSPCSNVNQSYSQSNRSVSSNDDISFLGHMQNDSLGVLDESPAAPKQAGSSETGWSEDGDSLPELESMFADIDNKAKHEHSTDSFRQEHLKNVQNYLFVQEKNADLKPCVTGVFSEVSSPVKSYVPTHTVTGKSSPGKGNQEVLLPQLNTFQHGNVEIQTPVHSYIKSVVSSPLKLFRDVVAAKVCNKTIQEEELTSMAVNHTKSANHIHSKLGPTMSSSNRQNGSVHAGSKPDGTIEVQGRVRYFIRRQGGLVPGRLKLEPNGRNWKASLMFDNKSEPELVLTLDQLSIASVNISQETLMLELTNGTCVELQRVPGVTDRFQMKRLKEKLLKIKKGYYASQTRPASSSASNVTVTGPTGPPVQSAGPQAQLGYGNLPAIPQVTLPVATPLPPTLPPYPPPTLPVVQPVTPQEQMEQWKHEVLQLFPKVDLQFLETRLTAHYGDYAVNNVCSELLEMPNYPKSDTERVEENQPLKEDTVDYYKDYAKIPLETQDKSISLALLKEEFRRVSAKDITDVWATYGGHYAPSYRVLAEAMRNAYAKNDKSGQSSSSIRQVVKTITITIKRDGREKTIVSQLLKCGRQRKSESPRSVVISQEIDFVRKRIAEQKEKEDYEMAWKLNEAQYEEDGQTIECGCCFCEYPFENMVQCTEGHLFCTQCLLSYAKEAVFGSGKLNLVCMTTGCEASYPQSEMTRALPSEILCQYEERVREENLNLAELTNLVRCPHCNYAAIMDVEADKVFRCQNKECMKETCRLCKEDWSDHIGLPCEKVEKKDETRLRKVYEEKMTEAKVRSCHRCKSKFMKEEGCNKMTCTCRATMCYICRAPNIDYNHFCRHPRDPGKLCTECKACSLWTEPDEDDKRAIAEIQKEAQEKRKEQGYEYDKVIGAPSEPSAKKPRRY